MNAVAPAADTNARLLFLQGEVARLRAVHEDLTDRERVLRALKLVASADHMKARSARAFQEFRQASERLAAYISRRQRGFK